MKMQIEKNIGRLVFIFLLAPFNLFAAPIAIGDASFEDANLNAGGWSNDLGTAWLERDGANSGQSFAERLGFSSEGNHTLGMESNYYVFQDTGVSFKPNHRYVLTVGIGNRSGFTAADNMSGFGLTNLIPSSDGTGILADVLATSLADGVFNAGTIPANSFQDQELTFDTDDSPPSGTIIVYLAGVGANRAHFDNIRVEEFDLNGDDDMDGLVDFWEIENNLDPTDDGTVGETSPGAKDGPNGALGDPDGDNLSNADEFIEDTDPQDNDTDGDGALDGDEVRGLTNTYSAPGVTGGPPGESTDPLNPDSDDDGLSDGQEIAGQDATGSSTGFGPTDPNSGDTDNDGFSDFGEISGNFDPTDINEVPTPPAGNSIGINFTGGRSISNRGIISTSTTGNGSDVAGVLPHSSWNNLDGTSQNQVALTDSSGASITANISFSGAPNTFSLDPNVDNSAVGNGFPSNGDAALMQGYLDTSETTVTSVIVNDITYPTYDVILYINGGVVGEGRNGDYLVNSASFFGVLHGYNWDIIGGSEGELNRHYTNDTAINGNYLVFHGLTGPTLDISVSTDFRAPLNGIQIINTDDSIDTDSDGIPDGAELFLGTTVGTDDSLPTSDDDADGRSNADEYFDETSISEADTDEDGLDDGLEFDATTDPLLADTDGDGLDDGVEDANQNGVTESTETDPLNFDTDGDNLADGVETNTGTFVGPDDTGTDPLNDDSDGDNLLDGDEVFFGSNPFVQDTDGDNLLDSDEVNGNGVEVFTDPTLADTDGDLIDDDVELAGITDATNPDTDGDSLEDGYEIEISLSNPIDPASPGPLTVGVIGLNFVGTREPDAILDPADQAGHPDYLQINWNNLINTVAVVEDGIEGSEADISTPLMGQVSNGLGIATPVTVDYMSTTRWNSPNGIANANSRLNNNYLDAGTTITVGNIPYPFYDVVVYVGSATNGRDGVIALLDADGVQFAQSGYESFSSLGGFTAFDYAISSDTSGLAFPQSNVVVFEGISGPTVQIQNQLQGANTGIHAFQIVEGVAPADGLVIESFEQTGATTWNLAWSGGDGSNNIEASVDLTNWTTIATDVASPQVLSSDPDPTTGIPKRFFRVVEPASAPN